MPAPAGAPVKARVRDGWAGAASASTGRRPATRGPDTSAVGVTRGAADDRDVGLPASVVAAGRPPSRVVDAPAGRVRVCPQAGTASVSTASV